MLLFLLPFCQYFSSTYECLDLSCTCINCSFHLCSEIDPVPFEGCAFVQFSHREMALAAISGLNGTFTMRVKCIYVSICSSSKIF